MAVRKGCGFFADLLQHAAFFLSVNKCRNIPQAARIVNFVFGRSNFVDADRFRDGLYQKKRAVGEDMDIDPLCAQLF